MVDVVAVLPGQLARGQRHAGARSSTTRAARARTWRRGWPARRAGDASSAGWAPTRCGDAAVAALRGVEVAWSATRSGRPARASCSSHPGGERTMIPDPGANDAVELPRACRRGAPPARHRLRAAARGLARRQRWRALAARPRARHDRLGRPVVAAPLAARRSSSTGRGRGPAAAERRRGARADRRAPTRSDARPGPGARGRRDARRRRGAVDATARESCARAAVPARWSTPPAPATRSPPGCSRRALAAPSRPRRWRPAAALAARAVARPGARPTLRLTGQSIEEPECLKPSSSTPSAPRSGALARDRSRTSARTTSPPCR